jgi:hypothetical protein
MIYFTGDTHGEQDRLGRSALRKLSPGDTLIICGDFGFIWDASAKEQKFLDKLSRLSFNICFLDGTHENFELLNTYPLVRYCGGKAHRIRPNVFHLLRGQVFTFENKTVFTMGGGEPPESLLMEDEELRSQRPEVPSKQDMLEAVENLQKHDYSVNYIVTHEPPASIRDFLTVDGYSQREMSALGAFLDELSKTAHFDKWYFGSMHVDKFVSRSYTGVFKELVPASSGEIGAE